MRSPLPLRPAPDLSLTQSRLPQLRSLLGPPQSCRCCDACPWRKSCDVIGRWGPTGQRSRKRRGYPRSPHWGVGWSFPEPHCCPPCPGGAAAGSLGTWKMTCDGHRGDPGCERTYRSVLKYPFFSSPPLCAWWGYLLRWGGKAGAHRSTDPQDTHPHPLSPPTLCPPPLPFSLGRRCTLIPLHTDSSGYPSWASWRRAG